MDSVTPVAVSLNVLRPLLSDGKGSLFREVVSDKLAREMIKVGRPAPLDSGQHSRKPWVNMYEAIAMNLYGQRNGRIRRHSTYAPMWNRLHWGTSANVLLIKKRLVW